MVAIVEYGVHLPLADLGQGWSLTALRDYARAASELGYSWLCANDHLVFARPWLDGLTALSAVIDVSGEMTLATTVSLPVLRGPAVLAKALSAIDVLSGGRLVAGVGPGSSRADHALVGVPFEDRWRRFDEALRALRVLLGAPSAGPAGGPRLEPRSAGPGGIPVWVASWGSDAGLRRVARLGDGWIASAYNTTPDRFRACSGTLRGLRPAGDPPLPTALATTWVHVSEDAPGAERVLTDVLAPLLDRPVEALRQLPIGPAEVCAERLAAFAAAGVERILLWPLGEPVRQLGLVRERVVPLVRTSV
ncbi:LLM class flavin-dependent oxidoreductase [Geodermatophilus aquaeductus]|uniref:LLM class flavin-dependent oxidoreductase n=1 Tax=Geodermatophilus aquaeductus TaxID=1564161 RepID=UPI001C8EF9D4|nr:LLM class flavin-dependent oxidoreductase [Geodermatophilus aquaeductus]